ncbi:MAG: serine--tRNA ligase, partial [Candidatus Eisenbacteria bacterium]
LGLLDFERAGKIAGAGFLLFTGKGARLERALIQFKIDLAVKRGYVEVSPPHLVRRECLFGSGQLPKLEEDMYRLPDEDLFLNPTAEVPITNIYRDEILEGEKLPIHHVGYCASYRREAGSYGRDTRGMIRVHQFDKVELVKFVRPETSYDEHEKLLADAQAVLEALDLPHRVLLLAAGDLSFAAAKCYDLETWAPGEARWLEVSSCSNFEDFQARRAGIRFRPERGAKTEFVHTLNESGLALPRTFATILEYHQTDRGTVRIPDALVPYIDGERELRPA